MSLKTDTRTDRTPKIQQAEEPRRRQRLSQQPAVKYQVTVPRFSLFAKRARPTSFLFCVCLFCIFFSFAICKNDAPKSKNTHKSKKKKTYRKRNKKKRLKITPLRKGRAKKKKKKKRGCGRKYLCIQILVQRYLDLHSTANQGPGRCVMSPLGGPPWALFFFHRLL